MSKLLSTTYDVPWKEPYPQLPKTLGEAIGMISWPKGNTLLTKLKNLAKQTEANWEELSRFPDHNQGMAMNMVANINFELKQIIKELE